MRGPGLKEPVTIQWFFKEPSWVRVESAGGQVSVGRPKQGGYQTMVLDPITRKAVLLRTKQPRGQPGPAHADPMWLVEHLRKLVNKKGRAEGVEEIGGVRTQGFRVKEGQQDWLIWADPETKLPVQVEITIPRDVHVTLSAFRFNPVLDDALFRLTVPEVYQLQPFDIDVPTPEDALVWLVRSYAETAGGRFPKRLDDAAEFGRHFRAVRGGRAKKELSAEDMPYLLNTALAVGFVATQKTGFGYRPDGVKLGEAGKILFWYRPRDSVTYRALYGDLHWDDVTTDQLPEVPKP
jgi:hypothetical protein